MKSICLYFQIHQPFRLKKYRFFEIGNDHYYYDDYTNKSILRKIARKSYLPANQLLLGLIKKYPGKFKLSFSITGIALEQFELYAPEVLDSFKALAKTGQVEFLGETYSHSLAVLKNTEEFEDQVRSHSKYIKELFGQEPKVFRNTELVYSDSIGELVANMGFTGMLAEGAKNILGWKSPNFLYYNGESYNNQPYVFDGSGSFFVGGEGFDELEFNRTHANLNSYFVPVIGSDACSGGVITHGHLAGQSCANVLI